MNVGVSSPSTTVLPVPVRLAIWYTTLHPPWNSKMANIDFPYSGGVPDLGNDSVNSMGALGILAAFDGRAMIPPQRENLVPGRRLK
jgi:hypothetical protein